MVKSGMLKTAEALIAIVMTLIFLVLVFSRVPLSGVPDEQLDVLHNLEGDPGFRALVLSGSQQEVESYINQTMPIYYDSRVLVSSDPTEQPTGVPDGGVFIESILISGNDTYYGPKIVNIYYWRKR